MTASGVKAVRIALGLLLAVVQGLAQNNSPKISEDQVQQFLEKQSGCEKEGVSIDSLDYFDFTGDGTEEAVVVASTCVTGTAGSDIHSVYSRKRDGSLVELKIRPLAAREERVLLGRIFYDLTVESEYLVEIYHDTSGRTDPLVVRYKWNPKDKEFQPVELKVAPRYKTSFDCNQANTQVENAICYSSEVALMDVELNQRYKQRLAQLNNSDRNRMLKEQKEWLRKRNSSCGSGWAIVECLTTAYRERLREMDAGK